MRRIQALRGRRGTGSGFPSQVQGQRGVEGGGVRAEGRKRLGPQISKADLDRAGGGSQRCHLSYELGKAPSLTYCPSGSPGSAQA